MLMESIYGFPLLPSIHAKLGNPLSLLPSRTSLPTHGLVIMSIQTHTSTDVTERLNVHLLIRGRNTDNHVGVASLPESCQVHLHRLHLAEHLLRLGGQVVAKGAAGEHTMRQAGDEGGRWCWEGNVIWSLCSVWVCRVEGEARNGR